MTPTRHHREIAELFAEFGGHGTSADNDNDTADDSSGGADGQPLPHIILPKHIAKAFGGIKADWTTQRATRWLQSTGAGRKPAGRWYTTRALLVRHWPDAADRLDELVLQRALETGDLGDADHECASCADLRSQVSELEAQVVELAERLERSQRRR